VYRVREGTRSINQKFIIGAKKAFPERSLDELFYLAEEGADPKTQMAPYNPDIRFENKIVQS
jgi:hypothetical protein